MLVSHKKRKKKDEETTWRFPFCSYSLLSAPEKIPAVMEDGSVVLNPYGKAADMFSIGVIAYFL